VNKLLKGVEHKWFDTNSVLALAAGTAVFADLTAIVQGDDSTNREGRKVMIESVVSSMFASGDNGGTANYGLPDSVVRVIIFREKVAEYSIAGVISPPQAGFILQSPTDIQSPYNLSQIAKYEILYDKHPGATTRAYEATAGPIGVSVTTSPGTFFERCFKKINKPYEAKSATTGNHSYGAIYMMVLVGSSCIVSNPKMTHYTRIRFTDN